MKTNGKFRLPFVKPSTQAFIDEAWQAEDYSWKDLIHGLVYAYWPYLYIRMGLGEHPLLKMLRPAWKQANRLIRGAGSLPET